jgi:putative ABC transport system permease protein
MIRLLQRLSRAGDGLGMDVRLAVRGLARTRGFTLAALASLALGIGANTALFSVVHATFLRPVPGVSDPERVVELLVTTRVGVRPEWSYPDLADVEAGDMPLDAVAGWKIRECTYAVGEAGQRVRVMYAAPAYFPVLGVRMALGRAFLRSEDVGPGQHPVVILSHRFWKTTLGGRADIVGQSITLNRQAYTVVGVAPEAFRHHRAAEPPIDLWAPLVQYPDFSGARGWSSDRGVAWVEALGRLRPGATVSQVTAALGTVSARLSRQYPDTNRDRGARAAAFGPFPATSRMEDTIGMASLLAFGGLVLLIICANLAGMMLARGAVQEREVAVRLALGAGRARLARRFLVDALVLAAGGGVLGTVAARWCTSLAAFGAFVGLPDVDLTPGTAVLGASFLLVLGTALAVGLLPALRLTRANAIVSLKDDAGAGSRRAGRFHRVAVSAQVAVAVLFMAVGGVFVRALTQLDRRDLGFDPERLLVVSMDLSTQGYEDPVAIAAFADRVREGASAVPGVVAAAVADGLPIDLVGNFTDASRADRPEDEASKVQVEFTRAGAGFFPTIGTPVLRGRGIDNTDTAAAEKVVVISRGLAERLWPGEDPLGRQLRLQVGARKDATPSPHTVVGVTAEVASSRPAENWPQVFVALAQHSDRPRLLLLIKARADAASLARSIQAVILSADPRLVFPSAVTSRALIARSLEMQRVTASFAGGLGAVALCLSAFGVYGLVAFVVSRRTREFGLRMALGATQAQVLAAILGDGVRLAVPGLVVGAVAAAGLTFALQSMLLGVAPLHPAAFGATTLLALVVVLLACAVPARRAARVDPAVALRTD